ncbi:hypothetical protein [Anaeroselena agilis]|uniref:Uncharacterized protein n=1 Tax=Anaeroselena agilis TaxID=3063788 RepID=A0ABU3NYH5_9FIRM|nr:hypothetical protein [Selenomonadales bacterium 4137-cl]
MSPNWNQPFIKDGCRFYGVFLTKDQEYACNKCKVVNPDLQHIRREGNADLFQCPCGNRIKVEQV